MQPFSLKAISRQVMAINALTSAVFGGMFGLGNTITVIFIFTLVSTNYFMNFYIGGFLMILGAVLLYKVWKRQGMITTVLLGNSEATLEN